MLAAGVRYRFANGMRAAMRFWGAVIVAYAIAAGLEASPPFTQWAHAWLAAPLLRRLLIDVGIALAMGVFTQSMFRRDGEEQVDVLPLRARDKYAIDVAAAMLFLTPPLIGWLLAMFDAGGRTPEPLVVMLAASLIGAVHVRRERLRAPDEERAPQFGSHEWRWLVRMSGSRLATSVGWATLVVLASELAIRNNRVTNALSVARIQGFFVALAMLAIAAEVTRARRAARPYRTIEWVVPLSSRTTLVAFLRTTLPLALAPLVVLACVRVSAVPLLFGVAVFALLTLLEGDSMIAGTAVAAAFAAAIDVRVAFAVVLALLPLVWRIATLRRFEVRA